MYYVVLGLGFIWFLLSCIFTILVSLVRWRNPANAQIFVKVFTGIMNPLSGLNVEVRHRERLTAYRPCIYIGNHQNSADLITHSHCYPAGTVAVGKKELLHIPLFGFVFWQTGNLLIDRGNHDKAMKSMDQARDYLMKSGGSIYMFPEGHRSKGSPTLLPFKKGAFYLAIHAQVPLVPVVCAPITPFFDEKNRKLHRGTVPIEVLEPIPTKGLTSDDVDSLLATAQVRMQESFDRLRAEVSAKMQSR
jgi:1-acyl-sn-glycerol-3-phosphate acyltransferase